VRHCRSGWSEAGAGFGEEMELVALNKTPLVIGELLKPVSPAKVPSLNPAFSIRARKSIPGMAPPSHLNQLSILV
jgi:hypothetical protein